jgi:hypothetical protein
MKITRILTKGGQKHVDFTKSDGKKVTKVFPENTSREKIDAAIKKLDSPAPAPKKSDN